MAQTSLTWLDWMSGSHNTTCVVGLAFFHYPLHSADMLLLMSNNDRWCITLNRSKPANISYMATFICLTITYSHPRMKLVSLPPTWSYFFPRAFHSSQTDLTAAKLRKRRINFFQIVTAHWLLDEGEKQPKWVKPTLEFQQWVPWFQTQDG